MVRLSFSVLFLLSILFFGCSKDDDDNDLDEIEYEIIDIDEYARNYFPDATPTESGMYIIVEYQGSGSKPQSGEELFVFYEGRLLTGEVFDDKNKRPPEDEYPVKEIFSFELETGNVIDGWHEGFKELNRGSIAVLLIPAELAYGENRRGDIPPNSPLRFDVELLNVE